MTAEELWDEFHEAYSQCPQVGYLDDDAIVDGYHVDEMKSSISLCVAFWMDPKTVGGSVLWEYGYSDALSEEIQNVVKEYQKGIKILGEQLFGKGL